MKWKKFYFYNRVPVWAVPQHEDDDVRKMPERLQIQGPFKEVRVRLQIEGLEPFGFPLRGLRGWWHRHHEGGGHGHVRVRRLCQILQSGLELMHLLPQGSDRRGV